MALKNIAIYLKLPNGSNTKKKVNSNNKNYLFVHAGFKGLIHALIKREDMDGVLRFPSTH